MASNRETKTATVSMAKSAVAVRMGEGKAPVAEVRSASTVIRLPRGQPCPKFIPLPLDQGRKLLPEALSGKTLGVSAHPQRVKA